MLNLKNIHLAFDYPILQNLDLQLCKAEFVVIIGSNGSGKSTLFNLISGFLKPDSGKIMVNNQEVTTLSQAYKSGIISTVMQDPRMGTMENMTLFENMAFALQRGKTRTLIPFSNKTRRQLFQEKLALLEMGLENRLDKNLSDLSGGQRQAVSLIMAIIAESKILLLDEITAALDPKTAEHIMQLAHKIIRKTKQTCLMITHNMRHAIEYSDRIVVLKEGKLSKIFCSTNKKNLTPLQLAAEL